MTKRQIGIMVGATLVMLMLVLTTYTPAETTTIRVEMQDLEFKNMTLGGVTAYISLTPAASIADPETTTHYFFILVENPNMLAISGKKVESKDLQLSKQIMQKLEFYEVVDFKEVSEKHQEEQLDESIVYWTENYTYVTMKPASSFSIPAAGTKWYAIALDAPTFEKAQFNVTLDMASNKFDLDPTITTCGTTLSSPGVYTLVANEFCTGDGVTVNSDDIKIDLQGYRFDGDRGVNDYGIQTSGTFDNLTFVNGRVTQFARGIAIDSGTNIVIQNMTLDDHTGSAPNGRGARIVGSTTGDLRNVTITDVDFYDNDADGMYIGLSSGSPTIDGLLIELSTAYDNGGFGQIWGGTAEGIMNNNTFYDSGGSTPCVDISGTGQWNFTNNVCYGTSDTGVVLYRTDDHRVVNNEIYNCRYGIGIEGGDDNTISGNTIYDGTDSNPEGVYVNVDSTTPQRNIITGNTIYNVTYGLRSSTTSTALEDANNFTSNTVYDVTRCVYFSGAAADLVQDLDCDNVTTGIYLESSSENNTITENNIYNASGSCIYATGSTGNNITNNVVTDCGGDGIQLLSSSDNTLVQNNSVNGSTDSCIGSNSDTISIINNTCFGGGSDGITLNGNGENHTITGNTLSDFTDDCYNLGPIWGTLTIADNVAYNCTDAGFRIVDGFPNETTFNNSWAYDIDRCVVSGATGNTTVWNDLACGYNATHGIANWTQATFTGTNMDDGTNVYFNPEWISINSTANPGLNSNATLTFYSTDNCSELYLWNASGFPATRGDVIATGSLIGVQSCTNDTIVYNATAFSGYALWNSENTYTVTYAHPNNSLDFACFQPYMNDSQPDYQDVQTPSVVLNNSLNATIYNVSLATNESLLSGFYMYTWTSGFRPPFTTQNWSKYGLGVVNIPLNITNATTTIIPKVKALDVFNLWFWGDCVNVTDNQSQSYNLTWGGGAGS